MGDGLRTPETLLADAAWVRRLARGMLGDEHLADDVAQEAWLSALATRPRSLRAWLRKVVRNLAITQMRRARSRLDRERRVARPDVAPPVDVLVERAELQRRLVDAVLGLDRPHRDVVLLRYFEGLAPRDIAARLGEPTGTVRSRLSRALDLLRNRLDRDCGERMWIAPLAALALPRRAPEALLGGVVVSTKPKVALVVLLLLVAAGALLAIRALPRSTAPGPRATAREAVFAHEEQTPSSAEPPAEPARVVPIEGLVLGRDDEGVPGARVLAFSRAMSGRWLDDSRQVAAGLLPVAETRTRAGGAFALTVPAGRDLALLAWAEGLGAVQETSLDLREGARGVALRLLPGGRLGGRVIDEKGGGIEGARLSVWRDYELPLPAVESGPDGAFDVQGVPTGECWLVVRHPAFPGVLIPEVVVPDDGLVVLLRKGSPVEGRVLRIEDRTPVADALVWISTNKVMGVGPLALETRTDAQGRYRFDAVPTAGRFSLAVDGGPAGRVAAQSLAWESRWKVAEVLLGPSKTVRGRLVRADLPGEPGVEGVRVRVHDFESGFGALQPSAVTDPDGRFVVEGVHLYPQSISPDDPRFSVRRGDSASHHPPDWDAEVVVRVVRNPVVTGVVVDPDGRPVPGARVGAGRETLTGADGRFRLMARPGAVVEARADGYAPVRSASVGEQDVEITLRLEPLAAGVFVRGIVVDDAGRALAGASVAAVTVQQLPRDNVVRRVHASTRTWGDGTFVLGRLPEETLTLEASLPGFGTTSLEGIQPTREGPANAPALVLRRGHAVRGQVLDASGAPVAGTLVKCVRSEDPAAVTVNHARLPDPCARGYADHEGRFELRGVVEGEWNVFAVGEGAGASVRVPQAEPVILRAAPPPETALLEGTVVDADGRPVPKAIVRARRIDTEGELAGEASLSGRFRFEAPPGRYRLDANWKFWVHGSRHASMVFPPVGAKAGGAPVEIRAAFGKTIEGRVEGPAGADLSGINVEAQVEGDGRPDSGRSMSDGTDALGRFVIVGLQDAPYTVRVRNSRWLVEPVTNIPAGTKDLRLPAQEARQIAGRLIWTEGEAPVGIRVDLHAEENEEDEAVAWVQDDGTFQCGGLKPGRYVIVVTASSPRFRIERTVEAGARDVTIEAPPRR